MAFVLTSRRRAAGTAASTRSRRRGGSSGALVVGACLLLAMPMLVAMARERSNLLNSVHARMLSLIDDDNEEEVLPSLFPLLPTFYIGFACTIAGLILAAGGGIGGGGIIVPIYILLLKFPVKQAIPLSSVTVLGGALANGILNAPKRHPDHPSRPCIDWDLILIMEPMTMGGALVGAGLNDLLPEVVLVVLLLVLLTVTAHKTLTKANALYAKESIALRDSTNETKTLLDTDDVEDSIDNYGTTLAGQQETTAKLELSRQELSFEEQTRYKSAKDAATLTALFLVVTGINLAKGGPESGGGGPFGFGGCNETYCLWAAETCILVAIVGFTWVVRASLLHRLQSGGPVTSDILWDESNTVAFSGLAVGAGLVAGLFGIGGGIINGPIMLTLGVHPAVAAATSATMIMFTSSTATVSYSVAGLIMYDYAAVCILVGFFSTLVGQLAMSKLMKKYQRNSYIAYSLGLVVALSAVCMTVESVLAILAERG